MLKFKKVISVFTAMIITFSIGCIGVFASEVSAIDDYVDIPILQVSENASQEEINVILNKAMEESTPDEELNENSVSRSGAFVIKPFIARSGNTTSCQLYLSWDVSGGYLLNGIAFDSIVLNNGSVLFPIIYSNIGGSYLSCSSSSYGSVLVCNITIPLNTTVYAKSTGMKGYIINEGWISCYNLSGKVPFN